ncbi:MAG: pectin acetylesterase-family hydrolase [Polyangiaceae bacterium]
MNRAFWVLGSCAAVVLTAGCSSGEDAAIKEPEIVSPCTPDESAPVPVTRCTNDHSDTSLPPCNQWIKVEPPGAICGDGSQYKFFVNLSSTSNNLVVSFEPGGACWDYESCAGVSGVRGAANPHGIADDHMSRYQYLNLLRRTDVNPAQNYNLVFVPYCTGDIHSGNNVMTYTSAAPVDGGTGPGGTGELTFHHNGHANSLAVIDWLKSKFSVVPKMLVTGCSAGGAGAILNYHFIREAMGTQAQCGYLLDDSGPIFHSEGPSQKLHDKIRAAWNTDTVLDGLDALPIAIADIKKDFGLLNTALARKYPRDRLSLVMYRMDLNYSLYSYQRFFPGSDESAIHGFWEADIARLRRTYDAQSNLAYFFPYFRSDNCSHCVSIPPLGNPPTEPTNLDVAIGQPWLGSEIATQGVDLQAFTADLLDDKKPLKSYIEPERNASFSPAVAAACMKGGG